MTFETGRATTADPSAVTTRADFAKFVLAVLADLRAYGGAEWENATLDQFLDALAAVGSARLVDGGDKQEEIATWRLFAEIMAAATRYE